MTARHATIAVDLRRRLAEHELDPLAAVQLREPLADLAAQQAVQRQGLGLDHGHLDAGAACSRRNLLADEAGPDDQQTLTGDQQFADRARILKRAQRADVLIPCERRQHPWSRAGGDHELLVVKGAAVGELEAMRAGVQTARSDTQQRLDRLADIPLGGSKADGVLCRRVPQNLLREWRAIVGKMRLGTDHSHAPLVTEPPKRLGAALRGKAAARDDYAFLHRDSLLVVVDTGPILRLLDRSMLSVR